MSRSKSPVAMALDHALILLATVGIAGCGVGSVSPLLSDADIQYDSRLVGTWQDSSAKESVVITAVSPNRYSLVYTDSERKIGRFRGVLGRVRTLRVLDLEPEDTPLDASDVYKSLLLPLHGAVFIDAIGPDLRFRLLESDSLKHYLQRQPRAITHVMRGDAVVLTAQTADLQRFLVGYVRRAGALGELNVWVRRSP